MSSFDRKIKKEKEIRVLKFLFGREPKHRCKDCHKMTLYSKVNNGKETKCVYCSGEYERVKEEFNKQYQAVLNRKKEGDVNEKVHN